MPSLAEEVGGGIALPELPFPSIGALVAQRAALDPSRVAARARGASGKWGDLTWGELDARRRSIAAGLAKLGVRRGDTVAVASHNSLEMLVAELGVLALGAASAPIFPDSPRDQLEHWLSDCGASVVFAGTSAQQHRVAQLRPKSPVIVLDGQPLPGGLPLEELSGAVPLPEVEPSDVAFVLYTGGTTGRQKGVELTHRNVLAQQAAVASIWDLSDKDVFLASLPWHHSFGALFERFMALWHRATLVIDDSRARDPDRLVANLAEVKPTVYFGVPRVYHALAARGRRDPKTFDALFKGRLRWVFSAAAPVSDAGFGWFEQNGVQVLEGWGLTEAAPCVTVTRPGTPRAAGTVGWPLPGSTVTLAPADSPRGGEAVVRGPQVMRGYRNRPEDNARTLREGALWTGDLAEWTANGLRLIGRVDGVFKLENGEKVSSGEVEARILAASPLVEQCVVFGHGQPFVTALLYLGAGPARRFCEERGLDVPQSFAELTRVPELRLAIAEALQAGNLLASVPWERVRRVAVVPEPPSPERGEITDTLRIVRSVAADLRKELVATLAGAKSHPQVVEVQRRDDSFGQQ